MKKILHLIPSAHLDPVWFWDWREGLNEGVKTCRTMVRLLEKYDVLTFNRGEAAIYEAVETIDPGLFTAIRDLHRAGRWDVVGGNVVQPDQNMPETAALIRQFEYGQRYFRERFGAPASVAWAADCFGHSSGMPEIYAHAGLRHFAFTRPSRWRFPLPDNLFRWRGAGGGEVLACRLDSSWYGCDRFAVATSLETALRDSAASPRRHLALGFGLGDHGGGPSANQIEAALAWAQEHPECEVRFSTFRRFFAAVEQEIAAGLPVASFEGELNFCLRGCYASCAGFKTLYREAERSIRRAERVAVSVAHALQERAPALDESWKTLAFNQFHDILPGTSVERAYRDQRHMLGGAIHEAAKAEFRQLDRLIAEIAIAVPAVPPDRPEATPFLLFNPSPRPFRGVVTLEAGLDYRPLRQHAPDDEIVEVRDSDGIALPYQLLKTEHHSLTDLTWRKRVAVSTELPAFGWRVLSLGYHPTPERPSSLPGGVSARECRLENGVAAVEACPDGDTVTLRFADGTVLPLSCRLYADPYGSWGGMKEEPESIELQELLEVWRLRAVGVLEAGPERGVLRVVWAGGRSEMEWLIGLERGRREISIATRMTRNDRAARLKLCMPEAERVIYDVPGGEQERRGPGQVPGVRYARVHTAAGSYAFATDGGYGYENGGGCFSWTFDKASRFASDDLQDREAFPEQPTEQDVLKNTLVFAPAAADAPAIAERLAFPPLVLMAWPHPGKLPAAGSLAGVEPECVELLGLKQEGDNPVLTLQNRSDRPVDAIATFGGCRHPVRLAPWRLVNLRLCAPERLPDGGGNGIKGLCLPLQPQSVPDRHEKSTIIKE